MIEYIGWFAQAAGARWGLALGGLATLGAAALGAFALRNVRIRETAAGESGNKPGCKEKYRGLSKKF
jgi:hypothetical protein